MSGKYSIPKCPWCGIPPRQDLKYHNEWETIRMECGSEIYPPRATSLSVQSEACKHIASLESQVAALQAHANQMLGLLGITDDRPLEDGFRVAYKAIQDLQAQLAERVAPNCPVDTAFLAVRDFPANRVLGEVAVGEEELEVLREIADIARPRCRALDRAALCDATRRLDALRAQRKDGAA